MNSTRIEKDFNFQSALHIEGRFFVNSYDIALSVLVNTDSVREQNVAMNRVNYFLHKVVQNSILVNTNSREDINNFKALNIKVCELPQDPYDQIFGMILLLKLNAIMENKLSITDMILGSSMSDGVRYSIVSEVSENFGSGDHWWNSPKICLCDHDLALQSGGNIVTLFEDNKWSDLGLSWKQKTKK